MSDIEQEELIRRRDGLVREMETAVSYSEHKGSMNHYASLILMTSAVGCTLAASILGIFSLTGSERIVGGIAALPAIIALIAMNLKFEEKSSWHYDKSQTTRALRLKLLNEAPIPLTLDFISQINQEYNKFNERKKQEWKQSLTMNFLGIRSTSNFKNYDGSTDPPSDAKAL